GVARLLQALRQLLPVDDVDGTALDARDLLGNVRKRPPVRHRVSAPPDHASATRRATRRGPPRGATPARTPAPAPPWPRGPARASRGARTRSGASRRRHGRRARG